MNTTIMLTLAELDSLTITFTQDGRVRFATDLYEHAVILGHYANPATPEEVRDLLRRWADEIDYLLGCQVCGGKDGTLLHRETGFGHKDCLASSPVVFDVWAGSEDDAA